MGDLDQRVSRLERELRVWRFAAVACVAVLSCKSGGGAPRAGHFSELTIEGTGDGQQVVVTPWGLTITAPSGDTSDLHASGLELERRDGDRASLDASSMHLSGEGAGSAMLARHGLTVMGAAGMAALFATDSGGQVTLTSNAGANTYLGASGTKSTLSLIVMPPEGAPDDAPIPGIRVIASGSPHLSITDDADRTVTIDSEGLRH